MKASTHTMFLALSLAGCAIETDTDTVEHELAGAVLLPSTGTGQDREVMSTFDPLVVTLTDIAGAPIRNATITFTAPMVGATSTFRFGGQASTDAEGRAELRPYANSIAGTYTVWAHADGAAPMPFVLTNVAAAPASMVTVLGSNQMRRIGMPFAQPLTVEVRDNWGNVVEGAPVQFIAPTTGATTRMSEGGNTISDDEGRAAVFATAGDMVGTYTVLAKIPGAPSISFTLSNVASEYTIDTGRIQAVELHRAP